MCVASVSIVVGIRWRSLSDGILHRPLSDGIVHRRRPASYGSKSCQPSQTIFRFSQHELEKEGFGCLAGDSGATPGPSAAYFEGRVGTGTGRPVMKYDVEDRFFPHYADADVG